jgi:predicted DNA binding CopG/RHH family protein
VPTEAHRERNKRYIQTQDRIIITVPKGAREEIKEYAAKKGKSMNSYLVDLVEQDIGCSIQELADKQDNTSQ